MAEFLSDFNAFLASPESYLNPTVELKVKCLAGLKTAFDYYKRCAGEELGEFEKRRGCKPISTGPLPELYTEGMDMDQIWEQIELVNKPVIKSLTSVIGTLEAKIERGELQLTVDTINGGGRSSPNESNDSSISKECDVLDEEDDIGSNFEVSDEDILGGHGKTRTDGGGKSSVVDDRFFKLSEMEKFLEMAEKEDGKDKTTAQSEEESEEEGVDYFHDDISKSHDIVDDKNNLCYEDFFDPPDKEEEKQDKDLKRTKPVMAVRFEEEEVSPEDEDDNSSDGGQFEDFDLEEGSSDDEHATEMDEKEVKDVQENEDSLSKHQKKKLLLQRKISKLEEANLAGKNWKMSGETTSKKRPLNSLLEEDLTFDHMSRPPLVVTEETTKSLEDIIKNRIIDEAWDDVERRVKPVEKPYDYSKSRPLNQEKSKVSLAEIYEQEYIKQTQEAEDLKEDKRHVEIKEMIDKLFVKLDALSNFHFTPKPPVPEVKIVTNVPAIQMEEVAPVTTSDATLLAPEELQAKSRRPEIGSTEKTVTDRKRERRLKKKQKRLKILEKKQRDKIISKLHPGLGNKYTIGALEKRLKAKEEIEQVDKSLHSSSKFFARLQEQVKEQVQNTKKDVDKRTSKNKPSAQQYKL